MTVQNSQALVAMNGALVALVVDQAPYEPRGDPAAAQVRTTGRVWISVESV